MYLPPIPKLKNNTLRVEGNASPSNSETHPCTVQMIYLQVYDDDYYTLACETERKEKVDGILDSFLDTAASRSPV